MGILNKPSEYTQVMATSTSSTKTLLQVKCGINEWLIIMVFILQEN